MKNIIKKISATLGILAILGTSTASASIQNRDANIVTDGNMEKSGTTDWVAALATISKELGASDNQGLRYLRVTKTTDGGTGLAHNAVDILTAGTTYRITGWARGDGVRRPTMSWSTSTGGWNNFLWEGTTSTSWQRIDVVAIAPATATRIRLDVVNAGIGGYADFDNISVTRYYGTMNNRDTQLMINGNFEAGYTGFTDADGVGTSVPKFEPSASGSLALRATYSADTIKSLVYTTNPIITATDTPGYSYRIKGMARGDGTLIPRVTRTNTTGGACGVLWEGTSSTATQYFDVVFNTSSCSNKIGFDTGVNVAGYVEFDNVSITRYYGAVQNRDIQQGIDFNFEKVGVASFGTIFANLTKEINDRGDDGQQFLRVAYNGGVGNAYATQSILTVGVPQKITGYWRTGDSAYSCRMVSYGIGGITIGTTSSTNWIPFSYTFTPNYASLGLGSTNVALGGSYCDYDNVSVTRVY